MKRAASNRRLVLLGSYSLLVASSFGCTPVGTNSSTESGLSSSTSEALVTVPTTDGATNSIEATSPTQISAETPLSSRTVTSVADAGIGIEIGEGKGVNQVMIEGPQAGPLTYQVTRLNSPERLVIDIDSNVISRSQTIPLPDVEYISAVRLGSHPGKSRVVFDLASTAPAHFEESMSGGKLLVTLASGPASAGEAPKLPMAQAKLPGTSLVDASLDTVEAPVTAGASELQPPPSADDIDLGGYAKDTEAKIAPDTSKVAVKTANASRRTGNEDPTEVVNVRLEKTGGDESSIIAEMSRAASVELVKTAPSEYVAYLDNAKLAPTLVGSTIIAPPNSAGIRTVRPVIEGNKVLLRIFAQPGTDLMARTSGTDVLIEMTGRNLDLKTRAQLDPSKTGAVAKAEEKKEKESGIVEAPAAPAKKPSVSDDSAKITVKNSGDTGAESDELNTLLDDGGKYSGRLISLDLQDTDIDNALRIIAEVSNLNVVTSEDVTGKVTLRLIDVPWDQALDVILKTNGLDKVIEGNVMRIAPVDKLRQEREALKEAQQAEEELEPLSVKYLRVSYAKASEIKPLVETVVSERGTVAYDERSNQLIVKDVKKGIKNVIELVNKIDLRTPQVLLETQIVEANRSLVRNLGAQLGFNYVASPATGNATGYNFPNSVNIGGAGFNLSDFATAASPTDGSSAVNFLFGSADGTKSLDLRLSQLEKEGRVRIVSRPAVATINNKRATIKSVEKIRILLPTGGFSIATGAGAQAQGAGVAATEIVEIGIVLNVTPQASPDYYVLLDIDAKSSNFGTRVVNNIPSELERSATSTVLVSSGQTFALGGIYKITDQTTLSGVPFLKDIPVLGHLFRRTVTDNSDEELLFFITPRIVEGSFDDAAMKSST